MFFTCAFDLHDDVTVVDFAFLRANMVKIPTWKFCVAQRKPRSAPSFLSREGIDAQYTSSRAGLV